MKSNNVSIKKIIQKRLKFRQEQINKCNIMNKREILRTTGTPPPQQIKSSFANRGEIRCSSINKYTCNNIPNIYQKKALVDFDVVICIPSYNRYDKIKRLFSQFYQQPTKYTFKIILLNDGSDDPNYNNLITEFPEIIYLKNEKPNGKILHWYCYSQMWNELKNIQCHAVLQMDDDFIVCNNFLNTIIDLYFELKESNNRILAVAPHLWSSNEYSENEIWWNNNYWNNVNNNDRVFVDGIALIDDNLIKLMNYELKEVDLRIVSKSGTSAHAWSQIGESIKKNNGILYRTQYSLVYHDGNDDSKLHNYHRKTNGGKVYTQKYIETL